MADLFEFDGGEILVLGVGAAGGRVAGRGSEDASDAIGSLRVRWSAAHSQPAELIATGLENKILLASVEGPFALRRARYSVKQREPELEQILKGKSCVFLIGSQGEATACAMFSALAESIAALKDVFICALVAEPPFSVAGADVGLHEFKDAVHLWIRVPSRILCAGMEQQPIGAVQSHSECKLLLIMQTLIGVLSNENAGSISIDSFQETVRGSGPFVAGIGFGTGIDAVQTAADAALFELKKNALDLPVSGAALAMASPTDLSSYDAHLLMERFRNACDGKTLLAGFSRLATLDDEAVCLALLRYRTASNIITLVHAVN